MDPDEEARLEGWADAEERELIEDCDEHFYSHHNDDDDDDM